MKNENQKETQNLWSSEEKRLERKERLNKLKQSDGQKKKISGSGKFAKIFFPIIAGVLVIAIGVWAAIQFAVPQKLFPPMSLNGEKISSAEFSYIYHSVLAGMEIDKSTAEGKEKLDSLCTVEEYKDKTWREYAYELTAQQIAESYILYDLAREKDLSLTTEEVKDVDKIFEDLISQIGTKVEADKYLMEQFGKEVTIKSLKPIFEKMTLADKYSKLRMEEIKVSDEEVTAVYTNNKNAYDGVTFRLAYFPVEATEEADEEKQKAAKEKAEKDAKSFLEKVTDGESFRVLAEEKEKIAEKEKYESMTAEEKKEADEKEKTKEADEAKLLLTMTEEEKTEYKASEANQDLSIIRSMPKSELEGANPDLASWAFEKERKLGDKKTFDFTTGYYAVYFVSRDSEFKLPSVRHILISPNKEKDVSAGEEFTKEEWDAARKTANDILGKSTDKDAFIELVKEHSTDPGSAENGGLYEDVAYGQMMPTFNDWSFDKSRKEGDTGIVRTPYGFHVMRFEKIGDSTSLTKNFEAIKAQISQEKFISELEEKKKLDEYKYNLNSFGVKLTDLG